MEKHIDINLWTARGCVACPPAKKLAKTIEEKFPNVTLTIRDVQDDQEGAEAMNLSAVPTWVITNDTEGHKIAGVASFQTISKSIRELAA